MDRIVDVPSLAVANEPILIDFFMTVMDLIKKDGNHIEFGHGKDLGFQMKTAGIFKNGKIFYYDTSPRLKRLRNLLKHRNLPRPGNLTITSKPKAELEKLGLEGYDSAGFFFTLHDYFDESKKETPRKAIEEAYGLLKPGGIVLAIDYDMEHLLKEQSPESARVIVRGLFAGTDREKAIAQEESKKKQKPYENIKVVSLGNGPVENFEATQYTRQVEKEKGDGRNQIYEEDWFEAHTRYCLDDCVRDTEEVGFKVIHQDYQPREKNKRKLFLMVARKKQDE